MKIQHWILLYSLPIILLGLGICQKPKEATRPPLSKSDMHTPGVLHDSIVHQTPQQVPVIVSEATISEEGSSVRVGTIESNRQFLRDQAVERLIIEQQQRDRAHYIKHGSYGDL
jgi:hypothetical protein